MMLSKHDKNVAPVWDYTQDADITFGEVHESKLPKIILLFTLLGIAVLGITAYLFRGYISDYVNNPQLQFKDSVIEDNGIFSVEAEISNAKFFDPNSYIAGYDPETKTVKNAKYTYTIDDSKFNPNTIGDYPIIYHSSNKVLSQDIELIVHLKDKTPPVISLELDEKKTYHVGLSENGSYRLVLTRGKDTDKFDPKNYIKSVTDNCTKDSNKIKLEYTDKFDFTSKTFDVIYSATDEFGNMSTVSLTLIIEEDTEAIKQKEEELRKAEEERKKKQEELEAKQEQLEKEQQKLEEDKKKQEEEQKKQEEDNGQNNNGGNSGNSDQNNNGNPGGNTNQGGNNNQGGNSEQDNYEPPPPEPPSISASDVTVSLSACGNDEYVIANKCMEALNYRGTSGVASPTNMPGFDVPLEVGVFTVTWTTTDGLSCTQKLTITE